MTLEHILFLNFQWNRLWKSQKGNLHSFFSSWFKETCDWCYCWEWNIWSFDKPWSKWQYFHESRCCWKCPHDSLHCFGRDSSWRGGLIRLWWTKKARPWTKSLAAVGGCCFLIRIISMKFYLCKPNCIYAFASWTSLSPDGNSFVPTYAVKLRHLGWMLLPYAANIN